MLSFSMVLFIFEKHSLMQFRVLSFTCVLLGTISSFFYCCFIKEDRLAAEAAYNRAKFQREDQLLANFPQTDSNVQMV